MPLYWCFVTLLEPTITNAEVEEKLNQELHTAT